MSNFVFARYSWPLKQVLEILENVNTKEEADKIVDRYIEAIEGPLQVMTNYDCREHALKCIGIVMGYSVNKKAIDFWHSVGAHHPFFGEKDYYNMSPNEVVVVMWYGYNSVNSKIVEALQDAAVELCSVLGIKKESMYDTQTEQKSQ